MKKVLAVTTRKGGEIHGEWAEEVQDRTGKDFYVGGRWNGLHLRNADGTLSQANTQSNWTYADGSPDKQKIREYASQLLERKVSLKEISFLDRAE